MVSWQIIPAVALSLVVQPQVADVIGTIQIVYSGSQNFGYNFVRVPSAGD